MKWQEYQNAVGALYEELAGVGNVSRNVLLPDRITGQRRQVDVLIELEVKTHPIRIVVDAKFRTAPVDVKDVEEVLALATAVGAHRAVLVAANGWTAPAAKAAAFTQCDLRVLSLEEALDLMVADKWRMCPGCECDCVVLDQDGAVPVDGAWLWWLAGQCRGCRYGLIACQDCGELIGLEPGGSHRCACGHTWLAGREHLSLQASGTHEALPLGQRRP